MVRPILQKFARASHSKGYRVVGAPLLTICVLLMILELHTQRGSRPTNGATIFEDRCAACHRPNSGTRAPLPAQLRKMSRDSILRALESGVMKRQGTELTQVERTAVAEYLGNPAGSAGKPVAMTGLCFAKTAPPPDPPGDPVWNGWGVDAQNTRFQPAAAAHLTAAQVPRLKLKWAFGFPGASATFGQPTVFSGRVYEGSEDGTVYSLDARSGCIYWTYKAPATVKTAVLVGNGGRVVFFGDTLANVYALDSKDGSVIWKTHVDPHPAARITGSALFVEGRLYVPVSSGEEGAAADPHYACCTFRGSVVALNADSGKQIWKTFTIPDTPQPTGKNPLGIQSWGPSGAAVWSPPTADLKRRAIYVATGNSYSEPPSAYSDSVMALDMDSGKMLWSKQLTPNDRWNIACVADTKANCPKKPGEDLDFGSPPILLSRRGFRDLLIAAQKSGVVHALDPEDQGRVVWQKRIGHGGPLGGIEWGGAAGTDVVYFPLSDWQDSNPEAGGGLFALRVATGERAWFAPPAKLSCRAQPGCNAAQMAPPTAIPGIVFSGSQDGHLRAYDSRHGTVVWDFDTARDFQTTNGVPARGGSLNATGPAIVDGILYANSGYTNGIAGNVLLSFTVDGK
jgi:polyvinyl alcohol dehydrogenase (cytochrome)